MNRLFAGVIGLLFGAGLVLGGMTDANKVIGFLDLGGSWDPTLAFVMGGAVLVNGLGTASLTRRSTPWLAERFALPTRKDIDGPLVAGAALFGLGWGLGGYCPGPGIVSVTGLAPEALTFVATMILGMLGFQWTRTDGRLVAENDVADPACDPHGTYRTPSTELA